MSERAGFDGDTVEAFLEKAHRALDDAKYLLADRRREAAINRIYYACLYAARAALLTKAEEPRSHSGVLSRFSYHFVRADRIPEEVGKTLARAETLRNRVDYDVVSELKAGAAEDLAEEVRRFLEAVQEIIEREE